MKNKEPMFAVSLIKVTRHPKNYPREEFLKDATHIKDKYWIYEGDLEYLVYMGVSFMTIAEGVVKSLGGLTQEELVKLCLEVFDYEV